MAAISGIKLISGEDSGGPVRPGNMDSKLQGHDPWYGPKRISSNPDTTADYQNTVTPSSEEHSCMLK